MDEKTVARFWSKVDRSGGPEACWLWTAFRDPAGYGRLKVGSASRLAHRVSFVISNGEIPHGLGVCHRCDVRCCVRPAHLFTGTHAENIADRCAKGRTSRQGAPVGARNGNAAIDDRIVREIRQLAAEGMRHREISEMFGVHRMTVRRVVFRECWGHVV